MSEADRVANFERIEALVQSGRVDSLPIADVRKEHNSLLRNSPTSHNPQFEQRWKRVEMALAARLARDLHWWQKPLGVIAIAVLSAILSAAVTAWLGLK
jgi:hypothetical protein